MQKKILAVCINVLLFRGTAQAIPEYDWHLRHLSTERLIEKVRESNARPRR